MVKQDEHPVDPPTKLCMVFHGIIDQKVSVLDLVDAAHVEQVEHLHFMSAELRVGEQIRQRADRFFFEEQEADFSEVKTGSQHQSRGNQGDVVKLSIREGWLEKRKTRDDLNATLSTPKNR